MMSQRTDFSEFATFGEASDAILLMMRQLLDLDLWLVARVHESDWIVLHSLGEGPLGDGSVLPLKATICNEMLAGHGPNIAPDIAQTPAYRAAPVVEVHGIQSYAGAPLVVNGGVYGVLCGMSSAAHHEILAEQTPHLITAARTLSTILGQQLHSEELVRRVERAETDALIDELTGLYNRRGWEQLVAHEQARGRRYGHKHAVFFMDIDGLKAVNDEQGHAAGDALIIGAADAIRSVIREHDVAARVGGDEFALLATETAGAEVDVIRERLAQKFREANVEVSIGYSRADILDLAEATREADEHMYRRKQERRNNADRRAS
jgi:diguanylate cyclase (GGDEF)-like protein